MTRKSSAFLAESRILVEPMTMRRDAILLPSSIERGESFSPSRLLPERRSRNVTFVSPFLSEDVSNGSGHVSLEACLANAACYIA